MKYNYSPTGNIKLVSSKLKEMSTSSNGYELLPGFSAKTFWIVNGNDNYFEISMPFNLFEVKGKGQSNFIAKIYITDTEITVEIKIKIFSVIVLIVANLFVIFFILDAIFNGSKLGFIAILFPIFYLYSILSERKAFIKSLDQLFTRIK